MIHIYALRLPELIDDKYIQLWLGIISEERRQKIHKFQRVEDQLQSLFAEVLLRYVLQTVVSIPQSNITFTYNRYGKPGLEGVKGIEFNLSHAGKWVLCALGNARIGADVEYIDDLKIDIAKRFFSINEYNDLLLLSKEAATKKFYAYWTLKESYIKAVGKGLSISLNSFEFLLQTDKIKLFCNGKESKEYHFKQFLLDSMYSSAICWKGDSKELSCVDINILEVGELLACKHLIGSFRF